MTPTDKSTAEALRLFGYRADATSISLLRTNGDGFAVQGGIVLAHARTLDKLAKVEAERDALRAENARLREAMNSPPWPTDAEYHYGAPVHVPAAFEGAASFHGHVVGWYRPLHGRWLGYAVEHATDHHVHVEPGKRLRPGLGMI